MNQLVEKIKNIKSFHELYELPLDSKKQVQSKSLRIGLINVPCGGFGDIIVCQIFSEYLQYWYPEHTVITCTTAPHKFKSLGIDTKKFVKIHVNGDEECETYDLLYFKKQPRKFDIMICIPIINFVFNINLFKKFIPYADHFNTFTMSEYNGLYPPYTFPIGVGEGQLGLFLIKPDIKFHNLIKKPYAFVYIQPSPIIGSHGKTCFLCYIEMISKKYSQQHDFFQVVIPPWIIEELQNDGNFKHRLKKAITTYYPNVWLKHQEDSKDEFFHGQGKTLILRGDLLPQPRHIFISLLKYSVEDVLLTGDQSVTDAFSCCSKSKKIWYQAAPWKEDFAHAMAKAIPNPKFETFKTACGSIKGLHKSMDYTDFIKKYDFRKLGKQKMDSIIRFTLMKDDPMIQFYMDSVLHSYKVESVIKKLKKKYKIE
mgnify:FL=1